MIFRILLLTLLFSVGTLESQILPERERAVLKDSILGDRLENLLPELMDRAGLDMWLLISREYNEDPVLKTMLPATWLNARRRTILLFYRDQQKNSFEKLAVARYDIGTHIVSAWDKEQEPNQWQALTNIIAARNPKKIGINISTDFALADGLVTTDYNELKNALPEMYSSRLVSAEKLAISWIETRTNLEMKLYKELATITHSIIDEAFSSKVIRPGVTSTDDVVWWMRQKVTDMGLETWFHPTIDIQRSNEPLKSHIASFSKAKKEEIINYGDLIHCDFGITYLGLNTDCQQHAYVLKPDEKTVPDFLVAAYKKGNRLQDILTSNFVVGKTGNQILLKSLNEAKLEGLRPAIYSHPLGTYGHSAGPTIGMWDSQQGVPIKGDYPLFPNTVYAIELNTTVAIDEWQKDIRIMLEEDAVFTGTEVIYINGRQLAIKPIKTN